MTHQIANSLSDINSYLSGFFLEVLVIEGVHFTIWADVVLFERLLQNTVLVQQLAYLLAKYVA